MDFKLHLCVIAIVIGVSSANFTSGFDYEKDTLQFDLLLASDSQLSAEEKSAFSEFKATVDVFRDQLPAEETYDYWFLLRFLSAKNFDVQEAYHALEEHMTRWQEKGINNILEWDWSDMEEKFPYAKLQIQSEQIRDSVALYWPLGYWDISTEQPDEFVRFGSYSGYKMMEDLSRTARVVAAAKGTDYSSKFHVIVDMKGGRFCFGGDIQNLIVFPEVAAEFYKEATDRFIFTNVPNVPTFVCEWSSEGKLTCPDESSTSGGNIVVGPLELNEV